MAFRAAAALGLLAGAAGVGPAGAGAWTQDAGAVFLGAGLGWYGADSGGYEELTSSLYVEWGARDWLTLGGVIEGEFPTEGTSMDGAVAGFARARLWRGAAGDPLSVQLGGALPLGDVVNTGLPQLSREREVEARVAYGRGFDSAFGPGWLGAEAAMRWRLEDAADELRFDLTAGLRPTERLLVMVQSFNTLGLQNQEPFGADYDAYKLGPSIGWRLRPGLTAVLGVEREIGGRNIDYGTRVRLSLWSEF